MISVAVTRTNYARRAAWSTARLVKPTSHFFAPQRENLFIIDPVKILAFRGDFGGETFVGLPVSPVFISLHGPRKLPGQILNDQPGCKLSVTSVFSLAHGIGRADFSLVCKTSTFPDLQSPKPAMKKIFLLLFSGGVVLCTATRAQTVVYSDDFATSQGATYTTNGAIGSSSWNVTRSGVDWGARIDSGLMTLNNDASGTTANVAGWVYSSQTLASTGDFNTIFSSSAGKMTWTFNMQQPRTDPGGFTAASYGVAYIIGASSTLVATQGNGYAVVLGNTGATDPIRFVSFTGGLQSIGSVSTGLIVAGAPLADVGTNYMSLKLTYDPSNNNWELFGRDDGTTAFTDPNIGTLTSLGTVSNSTYTGTALTSSGAYWQGSTGANQFAQFDNVRLEVVPEPSTYAMLVLAAVGVGAHVIRRRRR